MICWRSSQLRQNMVCLDVSFVRSVHVYSSSHSTALGWLILLRNYHYGASRMRAEVRMPYRRRDPQDLLHYPLVSRITGKPINWMIQKPTSGYFGAKVFGPNTIELKGIPSCRTLEFLQERLRRFFSKFGVVTMCRCIPHPLDPYQCDGTAYVTFRTRSASLQAMQATLQFPPSLQYKIIRMRHLDTDKSSDGSYIAKRKHWNEEVINVAKQLYEQLSKFGPREVEWVWQGIYERPYENLGVKAHADKCVIECYGSWIQFLTADPLNRMFSVYKEDIGNVMGESFDKGKDMVAIKFLNSSEVSETLSLVSSQLSQKLKSELSVNWRSGKAALPRFIEKKTELSEHKPKIPEHLQILSRSSNLYNVFDERFLFKLRRKRERSIRKQILRANRSKSKQANLNPAVENGSGSM